MRVGKLDRMSKLDLEKERKETEARLQEIQKAQAEYDGRRLKELRAEIEQRLRDEGYSIDDVFSGRRIKKAGGRVSKNAPKYRHPENPNKTWSGRGRQPTWYKEAIDSGREPEELAI